MNILVTGGCGFIGSNFIRYWNSNFKEDKIINLDKLTYAGNKLNLLDIETDINYEFIKGDISNSNLVEKILKNNNPTFVVNFAAESHVDRSIIYPEEFVNTNILGTFKLLSSINKYFSYLPKKEKDKFRFLHISTDEVYGSLKKDDPPFKETNKYFPNSPYSASKAGADHIVRSFYKTYNLPTLISNCSNNYGPYQSIEKLIPFIIYNALSNRDIPLYGDGMQIRDWIYVQDHCDALKSILFMGKPGDVYNIGSSNEIKNIDIAKTVCNFLDSRIPINKNKSYLEYITFIKDRPGHDYRYGVDSNKIKKKLGWEAKTPFKDGIELTIKWYLNNKKWVRESSGKSFEEWLKIQY